MTTAKQKNAAVYRLNCFVQKYDWGRKGHNSLAGTLFASNSCSVIDPEKPYAEFWMGTHESGPSFLYQPAQNGTVLSPTTTTSLKAWIRKNPYVLGDKVVEQWGPDLPFMFKVLSVSKALSIQAHPDKELAKTLHKLEPNMYKDRNHKPEMVLAITEFEALYGFIGLEELKGVLCTVPEIVQLIDKEHINRLSLLDNQDDNMEVKRVLQSVFTQLMLASKENISKSLSDIKTRLQNKIQVHELTDKEELVLRLEKQYPDDVGVISAFFFNHVKLNPGEALYLGPNVLHAYIRGECIECMATSDNVVRAGLTPKHRDVQTLTSMLTYEQGFPEILKGEALNPFIRKYVPPFNEFEVDRCVLPSKETVIFTAVPGPSIFVVVAGKGTVHLGSLTKGEVVTFGDALFVPANMEISLTSEAEVHLYRAGVNGQFFQAL